MVPRLIFAALVFSSLASRPDGSSGRHRGAPEARPAPTQATLGPAAAGPACR